MNLLKTAREISRTDDMPDVGIAIFRPAVGEAFSPTMAKPAGIRPKHCAHCLDGVPHWDHIAEEMSA